MKEYVDIVKELDSNIPTSAVSTRQGGGGQSLDYLTTAYVIKRLNDVLGAGNWSYSSALTQLYAGEVNGKHTVSYAASVTLLVKVGNLTTQFQDVGYGDGSDRNPSKPYELAMKEAVSDGLKRCAKNLGISFGLGLYFKDGGYVGDDVPSVPASQNVKAETKKPAKAEGPKPQAQPATKERTIKTIKDLVAIAVDQKRAVIEEFKGELKGRYNVERLEDLGEEHLKDYLTFVNNRLSA